jgi:hypothetical protein
MYTKIFKEKKKKDAVGESKRIDIILRLINKKE